MAVLVLSPFILVWLAKPDANQKRFIQQGKILEGLCLLFVLIGFTWHLLFWDQGIMTVNKSWILLPLLWAGLRFGPRGATAANLLLSMLLAYFTTQFFNGAYAGADRVRGICFCFAIIAAVAALVGLIPAIIIGERDKTMAELRVSEERFKNLAAAAFEGICISENGRIIDVNDQGLKMFGFERDEMIGKQSST